MQRKTKLSELVLLAVAAVIAGGWCSLVLVVALGFSGKTAGSTWLVRAALLTIGALITAACVRSIVRAWRRAVAQPLRRGRTSLWLARQPGWRLAIGIWLLYAAPELSTGLWLKDHYHRSPSPQQLQAALVVSVITASLLALMFRVLFQRQAENGTAPHGSGRQAKPAATPSR